MRQGMDRELESRVSTARTKPWPPSPPSPSNIQLLFNTVAVAPQQSTSCNSRHVQAGQLGTEAVTIDQHCRTTTSTTAARRGPANISQLLLLLTKRYITNYSIVVSQLVSQPVSQPASRGLARTCRPMLPIMSRRFVGRRKYTSTCVHT